MIETYGLSCWAPDGTLTGRRGYYRFARCLHAKPSSGGGHGVGSDIQTLTLNGNRVQRRGGERVHVLGAAQPHDLPDRGPVRDEGLSRAGQEHRAPAGPLDAPHDLLRVLATCARSISCHRDAAHPADDLVEPAGLAAAAAVDEDDRRVARDRRAQPFTAAISPAVGGLERQADPRRAGSRPDRRRDPQAERGDRGGQHQERHAAGREAGTGTGPMSMPPEPAEEPARGPDRQQDEAGQHGGHQPAARPRADRG